MADTYHGSSANVTKGTTGSADVVVRAAATTSKEFETFYAAAAVARKSFVLDAIQHHQACIATLLKYRDQV